MRWGGPFFCAKKNLSPKVAGMCRTLAFVVRFAASALRRRQTLGGEEGCDRGAGAHRCGRDDQASSEGGARLLQTKRINGRTRRQDLIVDEASSRFQGL